MIHIYPATLPYSDFEFECSREPAFTRAQATLTFLSAVCGIRPSLTIRWTPGHHGIPGNEAADTLAKEAVKGDSSEARSLPQSLVNRNGTQLKLPISKAALKQQVNKDLRKEAAANMEISPRYTRLHEIDADLPHRNTSWN